ncbi:MAG: OmpA family protein [Cyclobacteriaceae bacterium]
MTVWARLTPLIFASLFFVFESFSQDLNKIYKIAEETFYEEDFENALELYELLIKNSQEPNPDFLYKAEICSLLSKYPNKPLDSFLSYEETTGATDKFYNYWKGRILLRKYKMIEANEAFIKFLSTKAFLSKEIKDEVKVWRTWLTDTKRVLDNPFSYEIHHLEDRINTQFAELSPVYFEEKDELLFISNRDETNPDTYQIYHSIHRGDKNWTDPKLIDGLGTFKRDNSNIEVVAEDGRLFQFRKKKKGDLYYSNPVPGTLDWSTPVEFDSKITSTHMSSHFFINEHEDRIIFASNIGTKRRENLDLFESFRDVKTGRWSKPSPFAFSINSDLNEDSPYLSPDEKTLYFASNGHGSVGGYDIYMTTFDEDNQSWSEPVNMGFPINTPDDEIHFKLNTDQTSGYFTSNRLNTNGDYDIFFFWEIHKIKMEGRIVDLETNLPIKDAQIFFRPYEYLDMYFFSEVDSTGKFSAMINSDDIFRVEIIKNGAPIHQEDFEIHTTGGEETTYIKNFVIGKKNQESAAGAGTSSVEAPEVELSEDKQLSQLGNKFRSTNTAVLQNIYFDFGTSQLTDESIPTLKSIKALLEKEPPMQIEIAGHTDNIGTDETNMEIGMKRAETVLKWLTKNGISKKRLTAKSYGSTRPLASNDDEKEGRELNRRIEILVIEKE